MVSHLLFTGCRSEIFFPNWIKGLEAAIGTVVHLVSSWDEIFYSHNKHFRRITLHIFMKVREEG